jgi:hypothetical protein
VGNMDPVAFGNMSERRGADRIPLYREETLGKNAERAPMWQACSEAPAKQFVADQPFFGVLKSVRYSAVGLPNLHVRHCGCCTTARAR